VNRKDFKDISAIRLKEATILLSNRQYSGSFYLCGYAIECALKACIAKQVKRFDFPDKKTVNDSYTHDLQNLVRLAGLKSVLDREKNNDPVFHQNWQLVIKWSEDSRYKKSTMKEAQDIYTAITDPQHGVLKWIQQYW
jgi:hypothetical protein